MSTKQPTQAGISRDPGLILGRWRREMRSHRAWWALNDPVAYVWLCRAERRGAIVPWTQEEHLRARTDSTGTEKENE